MASATLSVALLVGMGALRRPRRVQRRNLECDSRVLEHSFSPPLDAGWDGAARAIPTR